MRESRKMTAVKIFSFAPPSKHYKDTHFKVFINNLHPKLKHKKNKH